MPDDDEQYLRFHGQSQHPLPAKQTQQQQSLLRHLQLESEGSTLSMSTASPRRCKKYNALLPYAAGLDDESARLFTEIRSKIADCLTNAEIRPGLVSWLFHLQSFIGLHGYNFSKEEHVELALLLLDILVLPDLDLGSVQKVASAICRLLRKKPLLTPDDLTVEWRPLYELYDRCLNHAYEYNGLVQCPQTLEAQLNALVRACRAYFPLSATREMLDEWLVDMCPFDDHRDTLLRRFQLFLPTTLAPEDHDKGWRLWFDRFMTLWTFDRRGNADSILVGLFARLAEDNVGHIDWEPHLADIFTRLLRSFNLPYGNGSLKVARSTSSSQCEIAQLTRWVVFCLGGGSSAQTHLEILFKSLESFYHPSNNGRWSQKLNRFLGKITEGFLERVWAERRETKPWFYRVPEDKTLSEADIDAFVQIVRPIALVAMFSRAGSGYGCSALQAIAWLRPQYVVPLLLDKLNDALYNLTEPHRLTSTLIAMGYVSRVLVVNHTKLGVPVDIPGLLLACLPGIDSNDLRKTTVTFQLIATIVSQVSLQDCSAIADDVSPPLQEVCLTTAGFEDFVLELISKCFALIENAAADTHHRESHTTSLDDSILDVGLASTFSAVFLQCSPELYRSAIDKLFSLVENKILARVPGKLVATVVRCAVSANPDLGLETFLPRFAKRALTLLEPEEVLQDEKVDDELQFSLCILSEIVRCNGDGVRLHMPLITRVITRALQLTSRTGYLEAGLILRYTFRALVSVYPYFCNAGCRSWELIAEDPPVLHWGKSEDLRKISIDWHTPTDEDMDAAQELFDNCVLPELERLRRWCTDPTKDAMSKEEVQRSLTVVWDSVQGLGSCLPPLKGELINVIGTTTSIFCDRVQLTGRKIFSETLRQEILDDMERVLSTVFTLYEDDIKSLIFISRIISSLVFYFGVTKSEFEARYKGYKAAKQMFDLRLCESPLKHIRSVIVDRAQLHHELRLMQVCQQFTSNHERAMKLVFQMAISHYSQVRMQAQDVLDSFFTVFPRSYRFVLDEMCSLLVSPSMSHDQYKGILYTLLGNKDHNIVTTNNWTAMARLWPSLVNGQHSEKPSIISLLNRLQDQVLKYMETYPMITRVPESLARRAQMCAGKAMDTSEETTDDTLTEAEAVPERQLISGESNEEVYNKLVLELTTLVGSGKLHWRHHYLGLVMLKMLLRHDVFYKEETARLLTDHLISEHLRTRKICIDILAGVLYQQKRKMLKVKLRREDFEKRNEEVPLNAAFAKCLEGDKRRPFNLFLQLNSANYPDTQEKWDQAIFVHKPYIGYSGFKDELEVYAPDEAQPELPQPGRMNPVEQVIYDHFSDPDFVKKLIFYLAIEENKGRDKFDGKRVAFFRGLFRNYGDAFLHNFADDLNTFLTVSHQESEQRCALEILAGLVRGAKHWNFEANQRLAKFAVPLFEVGMANMMRETMADWGSCVATMLEMRDCNKFYWVLEVLCKDVFGGSPFLQACKMYTLLGGLVQMCWRIQELSHRLLKEIIPNLSHPYLNVRERMAHLLANIFAFDIRINDGNLTPFDNEDCFVLAPKSIDFQREVLVSLETLKLENHEQEKEATKRLFQTLLKWQASYCLQTYACVLPREALLLIPTACRLIADTSNEELQKDCGILLALLGYELLSNSTLHSVIEAVQTSLNEPFWKVRTFVVSLLVFVTYSNLFAVHSDVKLATDIKDIVFRMVADERVEVRQAAQEALSGLIHCGLITVSEEMLSKAKQILKTIARELRERRMHRAAKRGEDPKHQRRSDRDLQSLDVLKPNARANELTISGGSASATSSQAELESDAELLIRYHATVLELCATIDAYPYDVPAYMPDVICTLAEHVNAPQPIATTIKKTLSDFKRTHHDNWRNHKDQFTEEQLTVVTDLLVSPSYYA